MELTTQAECDALKVGDLIRQDWGRNNQTIYIVIDKQGPLSVVESLSGLPHNQRSGLPLRLDGTVKITPVSPSDSDFLQMIEILKRQKFKWIPDGAIATAIGWENFPK